MNISHIEYLKRTNGSRFFAKKGLEAERIIIYKTHK